MTKTALKKSSKFSKASLIALASEISTSADVSIVFSSGLGQATAVLFRNGVLINMQSVSTTGVIHFVEVQSGDSIAINGICTGSADIKVSIPTNPVTPEHFDAGLILTGYSIS